MPVDPVIARVRNLDGVRGIAILMVLFHNLDVLQSADTRFSRIADLLLDRGWIGVQLFFVLSGFLITSILLKTRESDNYLSAFYMRRILRIFPLYYLTLIIFLCVLPFFSSAAAARLQADPAAGWLWVFISNWFDPTSGGTSVFPHFWSLAVEEQFYLLWPALILVLPQRRVLAVCAGMVVAALAIRIGLLYAGASYETVYMNTFCRMDALAVGAGIAAAQAQGILQKLPIRRSAYSLAILLAAGAIATHGFPRTTPVGQTLGYLVLSICCGLFLRIAIGTDTTHAFLSRMLQSKVLTVFGKYSFGIYVLHMPIHVLIGLPLLQRSGIAVGNNLALSIVYTLAASAVILVVAALIFSAIEKPFLDLKDRFKPRLV